MTPTDYTRLLADYAQACDLIAAQKRQIEALRGALDTALAYWSPAHEDGDAVMCRSLYTKHGGGACDCQAKEEFAAYEKARQALALQPASEPKPTQLIGEIHEIQRIEAILKGGSTLPASGSTPATTHSALPSDPDDGC